MDKTNQNPLPLQLASEIDGCQSDETLHFGKYLISFPCPCFFLSGLRSSTDTFCLAEVNTQTTTSAPVRESNHTACLQQLKSTADLCNVTIGLRELHNLILHPHVVT